MAEQKRKIECLVFSRVVGYYQPIRQWNKGKQQEKADRTDYERPKLREGSDA